MAALRIKNVGASLGGPVVRTPLQGIQFLSLIRELTSHMPCSLARAKEKYISKSFQKKKRMNNAPCSNTHDSPTLHLFYDRPDVSTSDFTKVTFTDGVRCQDSGFSLEATEGPGPEMLFCFFGLSASHKHLCIW